MITVHHEEFENDIEKYMDMAEGGEDIKVLVEGTAFMLISHSKYVALKDAEFRYDSVSK